MASLLMMNDAEMTGTIRGKALELLSKFADATLHEAHRQEAHERAAKARIKMASEKETDRRGGSPVARIDATTATVEFGIVLEPRLL